MKSILLSIFASRSLVVFLVSVSVLATSPAPLLMAQQVTIKSSLEVKKDARRGVLTVSAKIPVRWHMFSVTQPPGGPLKSQLTVSGDGLKTIGDFKPQQPPNSHYSEDFGIDVEEHTGEVIWKAPVVLTAGADPAQVKLQVKHRGQICSDETQQCRPVKSTVDVVFQGFVDQLSIPVEQSAVAQQSPKKLKPEVFLPKSSHVAVTGTIFTADENQKFQPGQTVTLQINAAPLNGYHCYAYDTTKEPIYIPTLVSFKRPEGWKIVGPTVSNPPQREHDDFLVHHQPTTWSFQVTIPVSAAADQAVAITGGLQIQTCNENGCDPPTDSQFTVTVPMGTDSAAALVFSPGKKGSVKKAVKAGNFADPIQSNTSPEANQPNDAHGTGGGESLHRPPADEIKIAPDTPEQIAAMARLYNVDEKVKYLNYSEMESKPIGSGQTSSADQTSFGIALLFALLGGALLNLMPCVFPVLGIKVMGFMKQGGENPVKVRMHGIAFAAGLVVSMWVLAGGLLILRTQQDIIWGEQMANPHFVGGIIVLLFLLGLNMAGVFEVGTSLSSVGGKITNQGGYSGSFFSGVLTTLIATPCSGPFLGTAMTYALSQPPLVSMIMFTVFGLGIALPYVLLTMFPPLINALPKPGPWMETFKITMAFALFATVAWFMQTFGAQTGVQGMSYMLMGLVVVGLAAFFYGTWGEGHIAASKRWAFGYAMPLAIAAVGFWTVYNGASQTVVADATRISDGPIPWVNWNPGKVIQEVNQHKIVWADYTADW